MLEVRVTALATNIPGPLAAEELARSGAKVVKVEPPQGDPLEAAAPLWYRRIVSGMDVLRLNLKEQTELARLDALLAGSDLFFTTLRPRALARLGLDPAAIAARYPRLCHVAVVGDAGEAADHAGHDLTYQARAGLLEPPAVPRSVFADLFAAQRAMAAAYELLYARERNGRGGFREVAIAAGAASLTDAQRFGLTSAHGPLGGTSPLYRLYQTADGWVALAALEPHFQARLRAVLHLDALDAGLLASQFAQHPDAYWENLASMHDLPLAAVAAPR